MNKALSYVLIGALGASAVFLYFNNRTEIDEQMRKLKQGGMRQINKIRAHFEEPNS